MKFMGSIRAFVLWTEAFPAARRSCRFCLVLLGAAALCGQTVDLGDPPLPPGRGIPLRPHRQSIAAAASSNWFDTSSRSTVQALYLNQFASLDATPFGWSGDVAAGTAGSTSQAYKDAVFARVNWVRALAGIPASVVLDAAWSAKDQDAAMMMSVNRQLSHAPPASWINYTSAGAEAAGNSNLCLGFTNDPGCIKLYMWDLASNNAAVGHRRWILYPQTTRMGTGDVPATGTYLSANALWVIDPATYWTTRPATRDGYVAWPPKGFVPYQVMGVRWSFSYPGADFHAAAVTMTSNGVNVPVALEPVSDGYGENTIVWIPNGLSANSYGSFPRPATDTTYDVTVTNVRINGTPQTFTYSVTVFDPNAPAPNTLAVWRVAGMADFNGDGKPDLVWQNMNTRQASVWYMGGSQGNTRLSDAWLAPTGPSSWRLAGTADFNGDGKPDLVWQHDTTRQVSVWYMGGAPGNTLLGDAWLSSTGASGWQVVAIADYNGDGKPDLVWQNDVTRQVSVWYMGGAQGNTRLSEAWLAASGASGWHVAAAADFNGDGKTDLVWQSDTTRQVSVWYMGGPQGNTFVGDAWLAPNPVSGWHVAGTADFNGDGKRDLVWQNDGTGQVSVWYLGGAQGNTFLGDSWLANL